MARKNSGSGAGLVILLLLGLAVKYWTVVVTTGSVALIAWVVAKIVRSSSTSSVEPSTTAPNSSRSPSLPSSPDLPASQLKSDIPLPRLGFELTTSHLSASSSSSNSASVSPDSVWVPCGRTIQHAGYSISGGLLYFGSGLQSIRGWSAEPALIDPNLPVDTAHPDRAGGRMQYWPSYSEINPASRAAFLEWLAGGRKDPQTYIGYVFIYFYGLERRALADAKQSASARNDIAAIITEVKRLLSIYGDNGSFSNYANGFLDALESSQSTLPLYKTTPQLVYRSWDVPFLLKVALGQVANDGVPLPVEWALVWAENDPSMPRRTPVQRCRQEFRDLFRIRYKEQFGEGITFKPNKTRLSASYRPASASFSGMIEIAVPDLPDITKISGPSNKISNLVSACTEELEGYSRYLGRNPDAKESVEAAVYLPQVLLKNHQGRELQKLRSWLDIQVVSTTPVSMPCKMVLQHVPTIGKDGLGKREATALANLLARMDIGMEPDPRFGTFLPRPDQDVVLFRLSNNAISTPSTEYAAATVVLHLASAVAGADGCVDAEEKSHLQEHLETWLHLSSDEKARLRAHMHWLVTCFPGMNGVKKRIDVLNQGQRESLGRFLIGVAQADGIIDAAEMKILTKIYEMLRLDTQSLYSQAHAAAVEPVTVQTADFVRLQGHAIPPPPPKKAVTGVSLDMSSIEAKLAETKAVSAILNNIFTEEEPATSAASEPTPEEVIIEGLDAESYAFMQTLASKLVWAREELEKLAADHSLMLDGTLDTINDASFDHFGGPFFEGDDPIEINAEFAKEIAA
jgi:uncharacterized tellurite resistance protein B-like protein